MNINRLRKILIPIFFLIFVSGCASIDLESAKALSQAGQEFSVKARSNIFVNENEYLRALDSEALQHGFTGSTKDPEYHKLLVLYNKVYIELNNRTLVFDKLSEVYVNFESLTNYDSSGAVETSLTNLISAINNYATVQEITAPISEKATGVITHIGGIYAKERQKKKVLASSKRIRGSLEEFSKLLKHKKVKAQITGFKKLIENSQASAITLLSAKGIYDPALLFNEIGEPLGLIVHKDSRKVGLSNPNVLNGVKEVISKRLAHKKRLIQRSYDFTIFALDQLQQEHLAFESGKEININRLIQLTTELQSFTELFINSDTN